MIRLQKMLNERFGASCTLPRVPSVRSLSTFQVGGAYLYTICASVPCSESDVQHRKDKDGKIHPRRSPKGHQKVCKCLLCDACGEVSLGRSCGILDTRPEKKNKTDGIEIGEIDIESMIKNVSVNQSSETFATVDSLQVRKSLLIEERTENSQEAKVEKKTVLPDGSVRTETSIERVTRAVTSKLEVRSLQTIERILKITKTRVETQTTETIKNLLSCDIRNSQIREILLEYLDRLWIDKPSPHKEPVHQIHPLSFTDAQRGAAQRRYDLQYLREQDVEYRKECRKYVELGRLKQLMSHCTESLSGEFGTPRLSLEQLCDEGNPFAMHLRNLRAASDDTSRHAIDPLYAKAIEEMTPKLLCMGASDDSAEFNQRFNECLVNGTKTGTPVRSDRLDIDQKNFAPAFDSFTIKGMVDEMTKRGEFIDEDSLTMAVYKRLATNGMSKILLDELFGSFAESILVLAEKSDTDKARLVFVWSQATRLFRLTAHYFAKYTPVRNAATGNIVGFTMIMPTTSPLIKLLDTCQLFAAPWREIQCLSDLAIVCDGSKTGVPSKNVEHTEMFR